ncbi:hypothetical protein R0131_08120 [Clostridium sp. AL.422]|uniref:hypothetical protein n=1 Tax=Clostridium TaxID=1485 RepID=UPI00293DA689|nr:MULTISPECIES: hypothetical protein [unclassified Clostridium]MDV4150797.1 hypothetical protein [Clostridium sp. AL.422]
MEERKSNLLITEIISRSFNLCTSNFLEILKVIGIFIAPALILPIILFSTLVATILLGTSMYYTNSFLDTMITSIGVGTIVLIFLISIISGILSGFGYLVITKILDDANKGNEVSWKSATKYVWNKKWSALGLNILVWLMFVIGMIVLMILMGILSVVTLGIATIILIPLFIAILMVAGPLASLFNSTFLVNELDAIDSIRETFLLFRKGYFWSTIGRLAALSGILIGVWLLLLLLSFIPLIGFIVIIIAQIVIAIYVSAYLNVFVLDRTKPSIDNFGGDYLNENSDDNFIDPIN